MKSHNKVLPSCSPNVTSSELDGEFVVINPQTEQAHALNGDVAIVWRAALDGAWPDLPAERVEEIVDGLTTTGLLVADGYTRRTVLRAGAAGSALAIAGMTTMALPSVAAAASKVIIITNQGGGSISIPAGATTTYTLVGGGGASGGSGGKPSGIGGNGEVVSGTITNNGATALTLYVIVGFGGTGGLSTGHGTAAGGTSNIPPGGGSFTSPGGAGGSGTQVSSGGGGGASAIIDPAGDVLVVAGGGGGGGGADSGTPGDNASAAVPALGTVTTGGAGGSTNTGSSGAGGGGGGGAPGASGGTNHVGGFGGQGFDSTTPMTVGNFTVTTGGAAITLEAPYDGIGGTAVSSSAGVTGDQGAGYFFGGGITELT